MVIYIFHLSIGQFSKSLGYFKLVIDIKSLSCSLLSYLIVSFSVFVHSIKLVCLVLYECCLHMPNKGLTNYLVELIIEDSILLMHL